MLHEPCELSIARQYGPDEVVCIQALSAGGKLLCRIYVPLDHFGRAILGQSAIPAEFSDEREQPRAKARG